ncbi:hypothetical protein PENTCL1PPCAC_6685 [Pristionchus entomophagus]|uniref:Uncharacterized protein n=1 Tax=Pristionchus entomophagus TaxID=358040 RepID=A0AAV5SWP8_9BILA|nr:hypothetical protein PENTCL1PPCAC_6685 [Pristionchus entomophagus]
MDKTPAWSKTYKEILKMKKEMDDQFKSPGARVYDLPMDVLVFDKVHYKKKTLPSRSLNMPGIVNNAFSLADSIRSHTSQTRNDPNFKMLSPRFAPVLPDKHESRGLLSPSILAFYKVSPDDAEDQLLSLPSLFEASGMKKKDRESLLEMIMEVSGARKTVDEAFQTLRKMNLFGVEGPFLEVTKKLQVTFKDLERSFTRRQKSQMKKRQFAFLEKDQLKTLYSKTGMREEDRGDFDVEEYHSLNHKQREESLWKRIEVFASNRSEEETNGDPQCSLCSQSYRTCSIYVHSNHGSGCTGSCSTQPLTILAPNPQSFCFIAICPISSSGNALHSISVSSLSLCPLSHGHGSIHIIPIRPLSQCYQPIRTISCDSLSDGSVS